MYIVPGGWRAAPALRSGALTLVGLCEDGQIEGGEAITVSNELSNASCAPCSDSEKTTRWNKSRNQQILP